MERNNSRIPNRINRNYLFDKYGHKQFWPKEPIKLNTHHLRWVFLKSI